MAESGEVVVEPSGVALGLDDVIGQRIRLAAPMMWRGAEIGVVLTFEARSVGIAEVGDEIAIIGWPDPRWAQYEYTTG